MKNRKINKAKAENMTGGGEPFLTFYLQKPIPVSATHAATHLLVLKRLVLLLYKKREDRKGQNGKYKLRKQMAGSEM